MTKKEFKNLEVGDYVQNTQHGQNKGKIGIISSIHRDSCFGTGGVYLIPYNCEFNFSNKNDRRQKDGLTFFKHESIRYLGKSPTIPEKTFYIAQMYNREGIEWSTSNFTESELKVIDRFLGELNPHIEGLSIDSISILDKEK